MHKYKIIASKFQKKYTFVVSTENEKLARKRIHDDGYSILSVELFNEGNNFKNIFLFEAEYKGQIKKGKVIGDDILKIYIKLVDGLGYNILKLYSEIDKDKSEEYKQNLFDEVKEQYNYYKNFNEKGKKRKIEKKEIKIGKNDVNIDDFYLKKELEETYKLIDFVLKKLKNILENKKYNLTEFKKNKLKNLYNSLVKIKSSTNISKLKEVGETVLLKIGEIELESLEKFKNKKIKKYLDETNILLKKIGSDKKFITADKDIKKQIKKIGLILKYFFKSFTNRIDKNKDKNKDKINSIYLKNLIFLNKYKQKLKQNNIELIKNFYLFLLPISKFENKKQNILIKRNVIKQNIYLFKAKIENNVFSYTKTLKGFNFILDNIFKFFNYIKYYLFYVVLFYSLLFLLFLNFSYYNIFNGLKVSLNYNGIFYFIMFIFLYFSIYFSRGIYSLLLNFTILFFIFNFGIINF